MLIQTPDNAPVPIVDVDYSPSVSKIIESLRAKNLRKLKNVCEIEIRKYYKLPEAQSIAVNTIQSFDARPGCAGWTLMAIYFGFRNIPDPHLQRFHNMTDLLVQLLRSSSEEVKAAVLIALGNIGPEACQKAMQAGVLTPCLSSRSKYTRQCARFAADELVGKPKLPKSMVKQVRQQFELDLPAYIEADTYMVGAPENNAKPKDANKYDDVPLEPGKGGVEVKILTTDDM